MRKTIKGAGMTAVEVTIYEGPEEQNAYNREEDAAWAAAGNQFEIEVGPIEKWAKAQIAALDNIEISDPNCMPARALEIASLITMYIGVVRLAVERNDAIEAARFSIKIGEVSARIQAVIGWETFALRGKAVATAKRGQSRLYREAEAVLASNGISTSAKKVRSELVASGVVRDDGALYWKDDKKQDKKTSIKDFEKGLSKIKSKMRNSNFPLLEEKGKPADGLTMPP
jgi:hypothetical protein